MQPFRYHVFVCEQQKAEGVPCCAARGSAKTIEALRAEIGKQGLANTVQVTTCGSIGLCERGPNIVVYPDGVWYSGVRPEDVPELVREHFSNGRPLERLLNRDEAAVRAEITENRNRYLAAMKAQSDAGVLPDPVMQTLRGYQPSRAILTGVELDLFSAVGDGATAAEAAARIQASERGTAMLLDALVSLELLTKTGGRYANTPVAARHFTGAGRDALMHSVNQWRSWSTLTDAVRAGTSVRQTDPAGAQEQWRRAFIAAMNEGSKLRAGAVVRAAGTEGVRRMLDIGGGSGAYSIAFAQASPALESDILDVPAVVPITREYIDDAGMGDRVKVRAGDLHDPSYGGPYDLVLISSICHMLSPQENQDMLRKVRTALGDKGRVVISDFILDPDRTSPRFAALFALNMLVGTGAGNAYTEQDYTEWLHAAGFPAVKRVRLPGPANLVIAA